MDGPWDLVTVIIVTFNSEAMVADCIAHVARAKKIIVVDNASTDRTVEIAGNASPRVQVIANPCNMGFGAANNIGFERVETPFALLLNPDAIVTEGCLETLVQTAQTYPNAAVVAPLLRSQDGVMDLWVRGRGEIHITRTDVEPDGPFCTGNVMGAVMLWRRQHWETIGGFDETFFLYGEDHDLCLRTEAGGFTLVVEPAALAIHHSGQSSAYSLRVRCIRDWHIHWGALVLEARWGDKALALSNAKTMVWRYGRRTLLYILLFRPRRVIGNFVKAHAAWTWLQGGKSWDGRS